MPISEQYTQWERAFITDHAVFWANLTRLNNLLVILNISLFFLTGLVAKGYFYTFISLICLGTVSLATILPTPLIRRLWYYGICLMAELVGIYYLVNSIVYWLINGSA
ncbi:MAG: hypothetical protein QNJ22_16805 [Desulfosarcinaceae bacterium]|nr:hypothetical protein [Desulfosarcinaceae bacterium]